MPLYNSKFVNSVLNLIAPAPASVVLCAVVPKGTVKPGEPTDNLHPIALSYPYRYAAGTAVSIPITIDVTDA